MRKYLVRGEAVVESSEDAALASDDIHKFKDAIPFKIVDVQQLPREAGGSVREVRERYNSDPGFREEVDQVRASDVMHPWDQGLNIFPDDHPLHNVEMAVKQAHDGDVREKARDALTGIPFNRMLEGGD